jgi:hypothetical protein
MITLVSILAACSKGEATPAVVETQVTTQEPVASSTQESAPTESKPSGVPEDVPIMPEAYDLSVSNQLNVSYKVSVTIADVVAFYQQEFANYGWDVGNNPDSVIGSMAQLSRSNAAGDRLVFSIQYNSIGEFSIVQIYITRAP